MQKRYHIQLKNRRTTITVDNIVSEMLALKLGLSPNGYDTHGQIREWLQQTIIEQMGQNLPSGSRVSQWARHYAIEAIADPQLKRKYWDWRLGETDE